MHSVFVNKRVMNKGGNPLDIPWIEQGEIPL